MDDISKPQIKIQIDNEDGVFWWSEILLPSGKLLTKRALPFEHRGPKNFAMEWTPEFREDILKIHGMDLAEMYEFRKTPEIPKAQLSSAYGIIGKHPEQMTLGLIDTAEAELREKIGAMLNTDVCKEFAYANSTTMVYNEIPIQAKTVAMIREVKKLDQEEDKDSLLKEMVEGLQKIMDKSTFFALYGACFLRASCKSDNPEDPIDISCDPNSFQEILGPTKYKMGLKVRYFSVERV